MLSISRIALAGLLFLPCLAVADGEPAPGDRQAVGGAQAEDHATLANAGEEPPRVFLLVGFANTYPRLESEKYIEKYFNPLMRIAAPSFEDVKTVGDLRDDHLIWPPHVGVGYAISPHWAVFFHAGYSAGKVRTKSRDLTFSLLPLHTDFELMRGAAYFGVGLDWFPCKAPELRRYHSIKERLRATRPVVGLRYTETYALYRAKIKSRVEPLPNLLNLELNDAWWVGSYEANIGADIPIDRSNVLTFNAGYNFPLSRAWDFEGTVVTVGWKHFFRPRAPKPDTGKDSE